MNRYIDADDFRREVWRLSASPLNEWDTWGVLSVLDRTPTADVAPIGHAHWIERNDKSYLEGLFECSNCSEFNRWRATYCPDCGAKMDGKEGSDK